MHDSTAPIAPVLRNVWRLTRRTCAASILILSCATPGTPRIDGAPGAPSSPSTPWIAPAAVRTPPPLAAPPTATNATAALVADSATTGSVQLSLTNVVDLALRNNPATRQSWALAQASAAEYGSARGALYPDFSASVNLALTSNSAGSFGGGNGVVITDSVGAGTANRSTGGTTTTRTQLTPALMLSYLVFDFGGRAGTIEGAKQQAIAANLTHNATINDVVLQVESALFSYLATRSLRDAQITAIEEARADTAAAEARLRVGVGTLQDVLQTRTALAQAHFQLETLEGIAVVVAR